MSIATVNTLIIMSVTTVMTMTGVIVFMTAVAVVTTGVVYDDDHHL
jgi:hypothetical protein